MPTRPRFRKSIPILLLCLGGANVNAQTCPPSPGNGSICNANDFNVTSTVITGPGECTLGETIAITVNVGMESTSKERYDIGLFAGDNGGPVIEGASCSFTSLTPLEENPTPVFDPDSGVGPYRDLDGDLCGDISKDDGVNQRIFQLDSVLCRDSDGDGRLDLAGLVTWSSNANQFVCDDPNLPSNFFPEQSSKCQFDPEFNLPIIVEPPPSIDVYKLALPRNLPAPGGLVTFFVGILNSSTSTDTLTLTSLVDDIHGNVNGQGTCSVPQSLVPGGFYVCEFSATVSGSSGYSETDTVFAELTDDEGEILQGSNTATVTITNAPASMEVLKSVAPRFLPEPGGTVTYLLAVANTSNTESIVVDELTDDLYGDVFGKGSCERPGGSIDLPPGDYMICSFQEQVSGQPGDVITDVITANATAASGQLLSESDDASVMIADVAASIEVKKTAIPPELPEPGGTFTFELSVQNTSAVDTVSLNAMTDRINGVTNDITLIPGTSCVLPQTLAPGEVYVCDFETLFTGQPGDSQIDTAVVSGIDDDGAAVTDLAYAQVVITDVPAEIEVSKTASPTQINNGDTVNFNVIVTNTSATDTVTVSSLSDDVFGDITQVQGDIQSTTCAVNQVLVPAANYACDFDAVVTSGDPLPTVATDIVTASGNDDEVPANPVTASDSADVEIVAGVPLPPDQIDIAKVAVPQTVPEPGGDVLYLVFMSNPSVSAIRVTSLLDDIYDVQGDDASKIPVLSANNCAPDIDIAAGGFALCSFEAAVEGNAGDVIFDTVTVEACVPPACGTSPLADEDQATVTITPGPASIALNKTASPVFIQEPGGAITFSVEVRNTSGSAIVTIDSLVDDVYGDLNGQGDCSVPQILQAAGNAGDTYSCSFSGDVSGIDGDEAVDIVAATGSGDGGDPVSAQDDATVSITGSPPSVELTKTASPLVLDAPGGVVTFSIVVTNTSAADTLNVTELTDDIFGELHGQGDCVLPQSLPPGTQYRCSFPGDVTGTDSDIHVDTITLTASTQDDEALSDQASAFVLIQAVADALGIPVFSLWWLAGLITLVTGVGLGAIRRFGLK